MRTAAVNDIEDNDDVSRQAREWLILLRSGQATRADERAYRRWCAEHPEHARKAEELRDIWTSLPAVVAEFEKRYGAVDLSPEETERSPAWRPGRRAFIGFAVAAGASWLALRPPLQLWPALGDFAADYRTGTGEQRQIALSRRISVAMNTQTRINLLPAQAGQRALHGIELLAGEAEIVATASSAGGAQPDPMLVVAGRGKLRAGIAQFDVRRTGGRVCVTCLKGAVMVEHPRQRLTLMANQQLIYDDHDLNVLSDVDARTVTAWREGRLIFDLVPLAQVVAEINRYRPGKLILRNAALGQRLVKAEFSIATLDNAIAMIRDAYGARVTELPGNIVLLS